MQTEDAHKIARKCEQKFSSQQHKNAAAWLSKTRDAIDDLCRYLRIWSQNLKFDCVADLGTNALEIFQKAKSPARVVKLYESIKSKALMDEFHLKFK